MITDEFSRLTILPLNISFFEHYRQTQKKHTFLIQPSSDLDTGKMVSKKNEGT